MERNTESNRKIAVTNARLVERAEETQWTELEEGEHPDEFEVRLYYTAVNNPTKSEPSAALR